MRDWRLKLGDEVRVGSIDCAGGVHYQRAVVTSSLPDSRGRVKVRLQEGDGSSAASLRLGRPKGAFVRGFGEVKLKSNDGSDEKRMKWGSLYIA